MDAKVVVRDVGKLALVGVQAVLIHVWECVVGVMFLALEIVPLHFINKLN
ncbi:MAG: hypothetical protein MJZ97_03390 [Bacteroidales bacterium]|nr:hypothetical protein [Bacteroidales bacterium]